jgi:hypothetical protein
MWNDRYYETKSIFPQIMCKKGQKEPVGSIFLRDSFISLFLNQNIALSNSMNFNPCVLNYHVDEYENFCRMECDVI